MEMEGTGPSRHGEQRMNLRGMQVLARFTAWQASPVISI